MLSRRCSLLSNDLEMSQEMQYCTKYLQNAEDHFAGCPDAWEKPRHNSSVAVMGQILAKLVPPLEYLAADPPGCNDFAKFCQHLKLRSQQVLQ